MNTKSICIKSDQPLSHWALTAPIKKLPHAWTQCVNQYAKRFGFSPLDPNRPTIATGHQAFFWHPGILAKDLAMKQLATKHSANSLHLIVDQDIYNATDLTLPNVQGDVLSLKRLTLGVQQTNIPLASQPAIRWQISGIDIIDKAIQTLPHCDHLAQQLAYLLHQIKEPLLGSTSIIFASDLLSFDASKNLLNQMLHDANQCVRCYNQAARAIPSAGISQLRVEPDRVELPIWFLQWQTPRQRVFADLADSTPLLVLEDGTPLPTDAHLAPRALFLTALMRSLYCQFFIHGLGGAIYDQVTEKWWQKWQRKTLAPKACVSADLFLKFDMPVSDLAQLAHAIWHAHHLPHNIDRFIALPKQSQQKKKLLDRIASGPNKAQRAAAFKELHQFNQQLAYEHFPLIQQAQAQLSQTKIGLKNQALANKRDWPFVLYSPEQLALLVSQIKENFQANQPFTQSSNDA